MRKCLECSRTSGSAYFCSIECACYSGCYDTKTGMDEDKLTEYLLTKGIVE